MIVQRFLLVICFFVLVAFDFPMPPPTWTGPTSPNLGTTQTYTFNNGNIYTNVTWNSLKGRVVSQSQSGTTYSVTMEWIASGSTTIQFAYDDDVLPSGGTYSVSVVNVAPPVPAATSFSSTQQCNSTTVNRAGLPASYAWVWYWQTSTTGTSTTLGNGAAATITTSGPLYLRARTASTPYLWSSSSQSAGTYTVVAPLSAPATANDQYLIRNGSGDVTLSTSAVANATSYRWYDQSTGGTMLYEGATPSYTTPLSQTKTFYVESVISTCPSTTRKPVTAYIYPEPVITASIPTVGMDNDATLSVINFSYDEYHWVDAVTNIDVAGATSSVFTTDRTGSYKVRVKKGTTEKASPTQVITSVAEAQLLNCVISNTVKISGVTDPEKVASLPVESNSQTIQYFDGLARPIQSAITQGSPMKKDIIQPVVYDMYGREDRKYLPVTINTTQGLYQGNVLDVNGNYAGLAATFYTNSAKVAIDSKPYSNTFFEASPFNRPVKEYGPGVKWSDTQGNDNKYVALEYLLNVHSTGISATAEAVIAWTVNGGQPVRSTFGGQHLASGGYYNSGQLVITSKVDEQGNIEREYTNRKGQVILKKVWVDNTVTGNLNHGTAWALTYYIYDDLGNLRFVFQPELSKLCHLGTTITSTLLNEFAFQYKFDYRNRMSEKKVPGAGWVYMVYDNRDRLVLTQDDNQRNVTPTKEWTFTKYDAFNRTVLTGKYSNNAVDQVAMQTAVNTFYNTVSPGQVLSELYIKGAAGNVLGYTNQSFPQVSAEADYYTVTYYDVYDTFIAPSGYTYSYLSLADQETGLSQETATVVNSVRAIGQVTGTRVKILGSSPTTWLRTVNYYDQKFRVVQSISDNQKSGKIVASNIVDFTGKVVYTRRTYTYDANTTSIVEDPSFDHADRVLQLKHSTIGSTTTNVVLVKNEYNELGQLVDKKLHSSDNGVSFRQSVDFRYNIRGWLTSINNSKLNVAATTNDDIGDLFGMELGYNTDIGLSAAAQYNGNISAIRWSNNTINSGILERGYSFSYDAMNRLKTAAQKEAVVFNTWINGRYNENVSEYDLNGNIKKLQRTDGTGSLIDDLTYTYVSSASNRLQAVSDAALATKGFVNGNTGVEDYRYDYNGNLSLDNNKGITAITYNILNLPVQVNKGATDYIVYTYDATGRKLSQQVFGTSPKTTYYIGELVVEGTALKLIQHAEGRILPDAGNTWEYQYHLKDHLGNVRMTFSAKQLTEVKTATLETANASAEQAAFLRLAEARKVKFYMFDRTNGSSPTVVDGYAQRLNGSSNEKFGLARSISVMPGDIITTEVYAKYLDPVSSNWQGALATLLSQLALGTAPAGTMVDGANYGNSYSTFPFPVQAQQNTTNSNESGPKAYLNWLVFKRDGTFLLSQSGFDRLSSTPREYGQDVAHERLYSPSITITEPGFVYIYISNEETSGLEVYFDDFKVTQTMSNPVVQSDDYYPFGLTFNSNSRENSVKQDYLYNEKELQDELNLSVYDYGARMYDPAIGRWWAVDPLTELSRRLSPYTYCYNNPLIFVDPDGMFGEYYAEDGTYIRSDNIDDDRAYVVSDTKTELLTVKNSELMLLASTSYGESSLADNPTEMAAISNAIINNQAARPDGTTLAQTIDGFALAASDGSSRVNEFNNTSASDRNGTGMQSAVAGAINAVSGGTDYSNGATHWAGDDIASSTEKRATGGLKVTDPSHDVHSVGSKLVDGAPVQTFWKDKNNKPTTRIRGTYSYTWETTAGYGGKGPDGQTTGSTFMRKKANFIKATGAPKY